MMVPRFPGRTTAHRLLVFSWRVLSAFMRNQGLLLAGGVGYNVLLSALPLLALFAVLLTQLVEEQRLFTVLALQAQHMAPAHSELLLESVQEFLAGRELIGLTGLALLLFFGTFAFRMLESAIVIIFHHPRRQRTRHFWVSAVLPYFFIILTGAGLLALTLLLTLLNLLAENLALWNTLNLSPDAVVEALIVLFSFIGMVLLFSTIYKVIPVIQVPWKRALIGGLVAATLWEVVRLAMVYYFTNISFVNVIYGSAATLIVILLSLEIAAVILLLGAQVIAELERSESLGLPWYLGSEEENRRKGKEEGRKTPRE